MKTTKLNIFGLTAVIAACGAGDITSEDDQTNELDQQTQPIFIQENTPLWSTVTPNHPSGLSAANINICWYDSGYEQDKAFIQSAIQRTWARVARINVWWSDCWSNNNDGTRVRVFIGVHDADGSAGQPNGNNGKAWGLGTNTQTPPFYTPGPGNEDVAAGVKFWLRPNASDRTPEYYARLEYLAVHEFGHVLGFQHDNDSQVAQSVCIETPVNNPNYYPGQVIGIYDPASIMNYCSPTSGGNALIGGVLSEGDITNVRHLYGINPRPTQNLYFADTNFDQKADALAVKDDGIYVARSTINSSGARIFNWLGREQAPFYGDRETLFGKFEGINRADGMAIKNDGNYLITREIYSLSTPPAVPQWWTWNGKVSAPFYGSRTTLVGDVNRDNKDDLIAVNNGGTYVSLSSGTSFGNSTLWTGPFMFGSLGTYAADVNGDGRADLIAVDADQQSSPTGRIRVALSNGSSFNNSQSFNVTDFIGRERAFADVNGDGCADAIEINRTGVRVRLSSGASFGARSTWYSSPFYGEFSTKVADVTGDGKADLIAVNSGGLWVLRSTAPKPTSGLCSDTFGGSFAWDGQWISAFYGEY